MDLSKRDRGSRAAQYVRMSTEHQRYSIEMQSIAIAAYAAENGLEIVSSYTDAGVSGLTLKQRNGLKNLLADVVSGKAGYSTILVFDVSRWGRFQDPDQAAYYEFLCREAGVNVLYVAENFTNDGSPTSSLMKTMKRVMAATYSRDLSDRISRAQRGIAAKGLWTGGPAPYGLRRQTVSESGRQTMELQKGDRKAIQGYRVTLIPGPPEEVATVQRIFADYNAGKTTRLIAKELTADGVPNFGGGRWANSTVIAMLKNEAYIGTRLSSRTIQRLGPRSPEPRHAWVRREDAFPAIISKTAFLRAADNLARRPGLKRPNEELLADLRATLKRHGFLSFKLLKTFEYNRMVVLKRRFGSLANAFKAIGYEHTPARQEKAGKLAQNVELHELRQRNLAKARDAVPK